MFCLNLIRRAAVFAAAAILTTLLIIGFAPPAKALPSYARQTGQPCGTCHTDFAGLTPYGRLFKIQGYTAGGGPYRTTLFPDGSTGRVYVPPLLAKSLATENSAGPPSVSADEKPYVPPLAMMAIVGSPTRRRRCRHRKPVQRQQQCRGVPREFLLRGRHHRSYRRIPAGDVQRPPAGRISAPIPSGIHGPGTTPMSAMPTRRGSAASTSHTASRRTTIRRSRTPGIRHRRGRSPMRRRPSVQASVLPPSSTADLPATSSARAPTRSSTMHSTSRPRFTPRSIPAFKTISAPIRLTRPGMFDAAPYWRAAYEPHWGNHWLEIGTFGMYAPRPPVDDARNSTTTDVPANRQLHRHRRSMRSINTRASNFWITLRGSVHSRRSKPECKLRQRHFRQPNNTLNEARAYASLAYGNNNRVVLTGQYFNSWGSPDALLYGGSPEHQRLDRRDCIHPVHQQPVAGMAVVQHAARAAIHLCTQNSTAPRSAPPPTTRSSSTVGGDVAAWRTARARDETNIVGRRRALAAHRLGIWRRYRAGNTAQGAAGAFALHWSSCYAGAQAGGGFGQTGLDGQRRHPRSSDGA